jgi:hypothetical protein
MINTLTIFHELQETLDTRAAEKIAEIIGKVYDELLNTVTKDEFRELTQVVQELSEAQKRTEIKVEELAEAQKRTEIKVAELAEAIRQLTVTQQQFARKLDETNEHLGGLTATVGYGLENHAYHSLPQLLQRDFGVTTEGSLHRRRDSSLLFLRFRVGHQGGWAWFDPHQQRRRSDPGDSPCSQYIWNLLFCFSSLPPFSHEHQPQIAQIAQIERGLTRRCPPLSTPSRVSVESVESVIIHDCSSSLSSSPAT